MSLVSKARTCICKMHATQLPGRCSPELPKDTQSCPTRLGTNRTFLALKITATLPLQEEADTAGLLCCCHNNLQSPRLGSNPSCPLRVKPKAAITGEPGGHRVAGVQKRRCLCAVSQSALVSFFLWKQNNLCSLGSLSFPAHFYLSLNSEKCGTTVESMQGSGGARL